MKFDRVLNTPMHLNGRINKVYAKTSAALKICLKLPLIERKK